MTNNKDASPNVPLFSGVVLRKYVLGLCGGSGSGKSTVCGFFASFGAEILDCDKIYAELVLPGQSCLNEIALYFGSGILCSDGSLDRMKLAEIVYSDASRREELNRIAHKYVTDEVSRRIALSDASFFVVDAPLLFESGYDKKCDATLAVIASEEIRVARIVLRDKIDEKRAEKRINAQISDDELRKRADYTIDNDSDISTLMEKATAFFNSVVLPHVSSSDGDAL